MVDFYSQALEYLATVQPEPPEFMKRIRADGLEQKVPIFHFTEIMALALGADDYQGWFKRHLVDPVPLLKEKQVIA